MARSALLSLALALAVAGAGCGGGSHPPPPGGDDEGPAALPDGGLFDVGTVPDGPPAADASGLCGNLILPALVDPPNLYFVVDASGSMQDPIVAGGATRKFAALRTALIKLVIGLGSRVRVGAAVFPDPALATQTPCAPGVEVFATTLGDAKPGPNGKAGPVTLQFADAITRTPQGGTPTSATLARLTTTLSRLPGRTFVVLATDGGPNCNDAARCDAAHCFATWTGQVGCVGAYNCCSPNDPSWGPTQCLDADPTKAAVEALAALGVPTYVVGLPSSDTTYYADLLDDLAIAGGTARAGSPKYYAVSDVAALDQALSAIGASVALPCTIDLESPPPDPTMVNVYFDRDEVPYDAADGWVWTGTSTLELRGAACAKLSSGEVADVQIVAGCPTAKPN